MRGGGGRGTESELLNIKQAAAFLNVSEVSLRRWTNSGSLPCLRVGAKRERRFRRDDLIAFLAHEGDSSAAAPTPAGVMVEGIRLEPSSHLCSIYRDDRGRFKLAIPFLADGLGNGHVCLLVAPTATRAQFLERLRGVRRQLDADLRANRLIVSGGTGSLSDLCDEFEDQFIDALHAGATGLRVLGDMTWHRDHGMDDAQLMEFETLYERRLARRYPVVALCQYDARAFSGTAVLDALQHHQDTFRYAVNRFLN